MDLNRENLKKIRGLILFTVIIVIAGVNYRRLLFFLAGLYRIVLPFIVGSVMAFIINIPMRKLEGAMPHSDRWNRLRRPVSLLLSIILLGGGLFLVLFVVAPEVLHTALSLQKSVPGFLNRLQENARYLFANNPQLVAYISGIELNWDHILQSTIEFLKNGAGTMLSHTFSAAISIISGFTTCMIGFIFSIYVLLQKEVLARQFHMLLKAFLPQRAVERVVYIASLTEWTFSRFFTGQCLEAIILGTMFFVTLTLFRLPYALLIGVLIAFTALIPIVGAFIGLAVGAFLMLMINPVDALIFTVLFFVLQQIEGNLIYPHVVGNSIHLSPIWVLVAVTVGGNMMGVAGMLIFIPLSSVLYALLRETVYARLETEAEEETQED